MQTSILDRKSRLRSKSVDDISSVISDSDDDIEPDQGGKGSITLSASDDDLDLVIVASDRKKSAKRRVEKAKQVPKDSGYSDFAANSPEEKPGSSFCQTSELPTAKSFLVLRPFVETKAIFGGNGNCLQTSIKTPPRAATASRP